MALPTTRTRARVIDPGVGKFKQTLTRTGETMLENSKQWGKVTEDQKTVSEGHPIKLLRDKSYTGDVGGPFSSDRRYLEGNPFQPIDVSWLTGSGLFVYKNTYHGPHTTVDPLAAVYPPYIASSNSGLDAAGATAISRCKPTNSVADTSTFLGELLKDGLPHMLGHTTWKDRTLSARNAGDEFLNAEFGWLPIKNDLAKFFKAVRTASTVINQLKRDEGRLVRRKYDFPVQRETKTDYPLTNGSSFVYPNQEFSYVSDGLNRPVIRTNESVRRQWFSGAFTYHIPDGHSAIETLNRYALYADKVAGVAITPELIWNLSPWSWAVDWFANVGDVLSNMSDWSTYGLVMRYGYMMEHTINKYTYTLSSTQRLAAFGQPAPVTLVSETKRRRAANPFGFGISWEGLNPLQLAIAAAIGVTR